MSTLFLILHLLAAAILIFVVLLQSGKAGDLASTFGGATSQTAFGARGAATMLTKITTGCAITFMLTSLGLSILYSQEGSATVMEGVELPVTQEAPADTGPSTAAPAETSPSTTESSPTSEEEDE
jgi:preprotein translocase subunit SecG